MVMDQNSKQQVKIPNDYKGFKLLVNNKVKYCRPFKRQRIIEYNSGFFGRLTKAQLAFFLEWCRRSYKTRDILKADKQALKYIVAAGYDPTEIYHLFATLNFKSRNDKEKRMFFLMTERVETPFIAYIKKLWKTLKVKFAV